MTALIAEDPKPDPAKQPEVPFFLNPMFLIGMMALFFILVILPAKRKQKQEQQNMMASMKMGSKVVTSSGILGTIVKMKDGDEEVVIRSEDTKIRVLRATITRVLGEETSTDQKA